MALDTKKHSRLADPGAELLDHITGFWDRYGRLTLSVLGVAAAVAFVTILYLRARAGTEERAAGRLAEAEVMFWQGYYPRSYDAAEQVIRQYPGTSSAIEAHRLAGDDAFWRGEAGDFKRAAQEYREYLKHRSSGLLADAARRSLAYALESDNQFRDAAATYEGLVGKFADRESSAEFLYAAARCYRRMSQPQEAAARLKRLIDEYGDTAISTRARIDLAEVTAGAR